MNHEHPGIGSHYSKGDMLYFTNTNFPFPIIGNLSLKFLRYYSDLSGVQHSHYVGGFDSNTRAKIVNAVLRNELFKRDARIFLKTWYTAYNIAIINKSVYSRFSFSKEMSGVHISCTLEKINFRL